MTEIIVLVCVIALLLGYNIWVIITNNRLRKTNNGLYNKLVESHHQYEKELDESQNLRMLSISQLNKLSENIEEASKMISELNISSSDKVKIISRLKR